MSQWFSLLSSKSYPIREIREATAASVSPRAKLDIHTLVFDRQVQGAEKDLSVEATHAHRHDNGIKPVLDKHSSPRGREGSGYMGTSTTRFSPPSISPPQYSARGLAQIGSSLASFKAQASSRRFLRAAFEAGISLVLLISVALVSLRRYRCAELIFRLSLYIVVARLTGGLGGLIASEILTLCQSARLAAYGLPCWGHHRYRP